jgi:hypothetical protein
LLDTSIPKLENKKLDSSWKVNPNVHIVIGTWWLARNA